jgi:hypothetical protein
MHQEQDGEDRLSQIEKNRRWRGRKLEAFKASYFNTCPTLAEQFREDFKAELEERGYYVEPKTGKITKIRG